MADFSGQELVSFGTLEEGAHDPYLAQELVALGPEFGASAPYPAQELVALGPEFGASAPYPAQELVTLSPQEGSVVYSVSSAMAGGATYNGVLGLISSDLASTMDGGASQTAAMGVNYAINMSVAGGADVASEMGVNYAVDSSFAGAGDLVPQVLVTYAIDSSFGGSADQVGDAGLLYSVNSSMVGDASVVANIILHTKLGFSFFFGSSNIFEPEIGIISFSWPFANLFAGADLTANAFLALIGSSSMSGGGTLFAPVLYDQFTLGTSLAAGGDTFLAQASLKLAVASDMSGGGSVLADVLLTLLVEAVMTGDAQMASELIAALSADATLAGSSTFTANNLLSNLDATLAGGATLTGEATRIVYLEASLEGQANYGATTLLWTAHPFFPFPFPAFNNAYTLQQFIYAVGVGRGFVRTPIADNLMVVTNPKSIVLADSVNFNPYVSHYFNPYYRYFYRSDVVLLSEATTNPFNPRPGG